MPKNTLWDHFLECTRLNQKAELDRRIQTLVCDPEVIERVKQLERERAEKEKPRGHEL